MMCDVYENVIVPTDGSLDGRKVLAPAADLAWRCGARVVNVSNTEVNDRSSKAAVKQQAISKSAADVEFWIDLENPLAEAALQAVSFRDEPLLCVASPAPSKRLGRRRTGLAPLAAELVTRADVPVVIIGPNVDTSRGLPMTEIVAVLDGTPSSDDVLGPAASWAQTFKLRLVLTALPVDAAARDRSEMQQYLDARADLLRAPGGVGVELVQGEGTVGDLAGLLADHEDAVVMIPAGLPAVELERAWLELVLASPRAVIVPRT